MSTLQRQYKGDINSAKACYRESAQCKCFNNFTSVIAGVKDINTKRMLCIFKKFILWTIKENLPTFHHLK